MNELPVVRSTGAWVAWSGANAGVLKHVRSVDLADANKSGYDVTVHLVEDVTQEIVDQLCKALGVPPEPGWDPPSGASAHQWSIYLEIDGLAWNFSGATQDPAACTGYSSSYAARAAAELKVSDQ